MHHHPILRTGAVAALALAALAPAAAAAPRDDDGRRLSPAALLEQGPRGGLPIVPSRPLDQGDSRTTPDPLFPEIGNKGYDARHYALELAYDPPTKGLSGTTTMRATALRELPRFSLDLQYYEVSAVAVDGAPARFRREGTKLLVTPASKLARGRDFVVATTYAGQAQAVIDPDGSREGFVPTSDGAFVVNQPIGAQGWFPNNNVPTDKATFDIAVTVPANREVQATGRLVSNALTTDGRRRWHWRATDPTATYLTTASVGDFELDTFALDSGQPFYQALDVTYTEARKVTMRARQRRSLEIIDWVEQLTGRSFPWEASGGTVDRSDVGYALETQTKPSYAINSLNSNGPSLSTIAHEHAHEWFGNSVSPHTWMDIWLNEGFADWVALAWNHEANGTQSPAAFFDELYADREYDIWDVAPAALPDATYLFHPTVYDRGAMVVEAVRQILGDDRFRAMLGTWYDEHRTSTATTADLIALVKRVDARGRGDRWDEFFQQWLYTAYTDDVSAPTITPGTF